METMGVDIATVPEVETGARVFNLDGLPDW